MSFDVEVTVGHLSTVATRNYLIVGALVLLVWEYLVTVRDEVRFIWRRPFNHVKFLYILSRYYGLAAQSINVYLTLDRLSHLPLHQDTCRTWALFLIISSAILLAALDIILMLRVYALYNKDPNVGYMLLGLFIMELGVDFGCAYAVYHKTPYDVTCDSYEMPFHSVYLTSPVIAMQTVIWTMTLHKTHTLGARQSIPLLGVVMRDGAWIFLLLVSIYMSTIPYVAASRVMRTHAALILPISMLSVSGCRLIMNMQRLRLDPPTTPPERSCAESDSVCLTSCIELEE